MDNMLEKLKVLRDACILQQASWTNELIECGDFTYGHPVVHQWDNVTRLKIGKFCSIGAGVNILLGGEHHSEWITTYPLDVLLNDGVAKSKGDVIIGNDVWIGDFVTILSGVTIGDGAVIGAGSVVTKDVGKYAVSGGNPARTIRQRFELEDMAKLIEIQWWLWPVDVIAEIYPMLTAGDIDALYRYWKEWVS